MRSRFSMSSASRSSTTPRTPAASPALAIFTYSGSKGGPMRARPAEKVPPPRIASVSVSSIVRNARFRCCRPSASNARTSGIPAPTSVASCRVNAASSFGRSGLPPSGLHLEPSPRAFAFSAPATPLSVFSWRGAHREPCRSLIPSPLSPVADIFISLPKRLPGLLSFTRSSLKSASVQIAHTPPKKGRDGRPARTARLRSSLDPRPAGRASLPHTKRSQSVVAAKTHKNTTKSDPLRFCVLCAF